MTKIKTVSAAILSEQKKNGTFDSAYFYLGEGFAGEFQIDEVQPLTRTKEDGTTVEYSHKVLGTSPRGTVGIHGSLMAKSLLIKKEKISDLVKVDNAVNGVKDVWYIDDIEALCGGKYKDLYPTNAEGEFEDYEYPESLNIVGAAVFKNSFGETDHPHILLFKYPFYPMLLAHHRKIVGDDKARMSYEQARYYTELPVGKRPEGIPDDYVLSVSEEMKKDPAKWSFRLIFEDPRV
jgi:hypothetical protein